MKHTPGPWFVRRAEPTRRPRVYAECKPLHALATIYFSEANAYLIAAAPDLLAALEISRGQWIYSVNAKQCLDAIAKARVWSDSRLTA